MIRNRLLVAVFSDEALVFNVAPFDEDNPGTHDVVTEVAASTVERWQRTADEYAAMQEEILDSAYTHCVAGHRIPIGTDCRCGK